jgi:hypothetical protein
MSKQCAALKVPARYVSLLVFSISTIALVGCGSKGASDSVSGKVTMNGQIVAGQVIFITSDKKEIASPITAEGVYTINNPPKGEVQIIVKGAVAPGGPVARPIPKGDKTPGEPPPSPMASSGATPPAKYAQAGNGLKFTVTGGQQTYDIDLK